MPTLLWGGGGGWEKGRTSSRRVDIVVPVLQVRELGFHALIPGGLEGQATHRAPWFSPLQSHDASPAPFSSPFPLCWGPRVDIPWPPDPRELRGGGNTFLLSVCFEG